MNISVCRYTLPSTSYPSCNGRILRLDLHHLGEEGLGPEESESHVGRLREVLQDFGGGKGLGGGTIVDQLHVHLVGVGWGWGVASGSGRGGDYWTVNGQW